MPDELKDRMNVLDSVRPDPDLKRRIGTVLPESDSAHPSLKSRAMVAVVAAGVAAGGFIFAIRAFDSPPQQGQPGGRANYTSGTLPASITLTCSSGSAALSGTAVAAQSDGVHVTVDNEMGSGIEILPSTGDAVDVPEGMSTLVLSIPPGAAYLSCGGDDQAPSALVSVEDPDGLWIPVKLDCGGNNIVVSGTSYGPGAASNEPPLAQARRDFDGIEGDTFEVAGYPDAPVTLVRVVRGDLAVAMLTYTKSGDGWVLAADRHCA
jgi:hypothetical protein